MALGTLATAGITAGIGAAGNLLGSIGSNRATKKAQKRQFEYDRQAYEYQRADAVADRDLQRQWALQDLQSEREYNDPSMQLQRYRDAGLNPNLIYGEGVNASSGNAGQPNPTDTRSSSPGHSSLGQYSLDFGANQFANNLLVSAQAENLKSQAAKNYADAGLKGTQETRLRDLLPLEKDGRTIDIARTRAQINEISSQILVNESVISKQDAERIESNARVKKLFNDTVLGYLSYQNSIRQLDINEYDSQTRRGTLAATNRDVATRERGQNTNEERLQFERSKQKFDEAAKRAGIEIEQFGSLWKTLGSVVRGTSDVIGSAFGENSNTYNFLYGPSKPKQKYRDLPRRDSIKRYLQP